MEEAWWLPSFEEIDKIFFLNLVALVSADRVVKRPEKVVIRRCLLTNCHFGEVNVRHVDLLYFIESQRAWEFFAVAVNVGAVVWCGFLVSGLEVA